jgi:hypothetical protein
MTIVLLLSVALVLVLLLLPLLLVVAGVGLFAALIAGVIGVELLRGLPEPVFRELRQELEELRQELKDLPTEAAREYWREQEEGTARARALLGGWCRAHCGTPWASGGLLSCDCGCGEPKARKLPKVEAERLRGAEEFVEVGTGAFLAPDPAVGSSGCGGAAGVSEAGCPSVCTSGGGILAALDRALLR